MKTVIKMAVLAAVFVAGLFIGNIDLNSKYNNLVEIAELQAVKIAVIEQAAKLEQYHQQLAKRQRDREAVVQKALAPKDVNVDR